MFFHFARDLDASQDPGFPYCYLGTEAVPGPWLGGSWDSLTEYVQYPVHPLDLNTKSLCPQPSPIDWRHKL
jgi:hypothetical protein